jgi:spore maturation protein CgeB
MKIVILGESGFDLAGFHWKDSFEHLGHKSVIIPFSKSIPLGLSNTFARKADYYVSLAFEKYEIYKANLLFKEVLKEKPDLLFCLYWSIHPIFFDLVRKNLRECKIIHNNSDAISNFNRQQVFVSDIDYYFTKEPFIADFLKNKLNKKAVYMPEWFNPRIHKRPKLSKEDAEKILDIDVLVFGSLYPYRTEMVKLLLESKINVKVFGKKTPYFPSSLLPYYKNLYLAGDQKSEYLYGAKIVFNNMHYAEIKSVNQKYFEINGIGGFQICDFKPTLEEYCPVTCKMTSFSFISEAIEKIRYFLERPKERHEISEMNYHHFQENHHIDLRSEAILKIVFG